MIETANIRFERIERLLHDLKYEVTRGMMEKEIDESMGFRFYVPISSSLPDGVVFCEFRTRPILRYQMYGGEMKPRLELIKSA